MLAQYQKNEQPNQKVDQRTTRGIISYWPDWLPSKSLQTINAREDVEQREPSYTVGGNTNWYSHYGEQCGDSLRKKLGMKLYDPTIPLLGVYPKENIIERDTHTPLFSAALFTIVKTWKQPRCPSTDE